MISQTCVEDQAGGVGCLFSENHDCAKLCLGVVSAWLFQFTAGSGMYNHCLVQRFSCHCIETMGKIMGLGEIGLNY